jgi:ribose transport system substrate-binding protein
VRRAKARLTRTGAALTAAALALAMAACSTGTTTAAGAAGGKDIELPAMKAVTTFVGPSESFDAPKKKHIMVLVCGNTGYGCVREGNAVKQAAAELGWTADLVDGRLDPTVWNRAVKQAVDSGIDGIVSVASDPNLMGDAMQQVAAKKVPFVMLGQTPKDGDVPGVQTWIRPDTAEGGKAAAAWIKADSDGKGTVLVLDLPDFTDIMKRHDTITGTLKSECPGCKVHRAEVASQTIGTSLAPLVTSQLRQHPDVNYVWGPDDSVGDFVAQGIQQAGKSSAVKLLSTSGTTPSSVARLKNGTQAADLLFPDNYMGWLAVDSLARGLAGRPVVKLWDAPQRLFTAKNIGEAPSTLADEGWNTEFEYKPEFRKLWGLQ